MSSPNDPANLPDPHAGEDTVAMSETAFAKLKDGAGGLCTKCNTPLGDGALHGVCARCWMAAGLAGTAEPPPESMPEIPGYRFTRFLGRGGMGVVWLAEQLATKQIVAVKLCPPQEREPESGTVAKNMRQRFAREVELAARLRHPNIVRVLAGGECDGVPYYVMDYVEGQTLGDYLAEKNPDLRTRVALLRAACAGVQQAHAQGIVHRDLKPANILIEKDGTPRVLDFGLAKVTEEHAHASINISTTGQVLGTPRYMAPEQVRGESASPSTDVYALGVILYESLTGEHPHNARCSLQALLYRITHEEPRRPREIRADLDDKMEMLLLKALQADPQDRYADAGELAEELDRWLAQRPLEAGRATPAYFARRWLLRRWLPVSAALIALGVAGYFIVMQSQISRLHGLLEKQSQLTERILQTAPNRGVESPNALENGRRQVAAQQGISLAELDQRLQREDREVSSVLGEIETRRKSAGALGGEWQRLEREALRRLADTARASGRHDESYRRYCQALALVDEKTDPAEWVAATQNVQVSLSDLGRFAEAEPIARDLLARRTAQLGAAHPDTLSSVNNLANVLLEKGDAAGAEPLYRRALAERERTLGAGHPDTVRSLNNLATLLTKSGRAADAEPLYRRALAAAEKSLGPEDPETLMTASNLGNLLMENRDFAGAEKLLRQALAGQEKVLGPEHPHTLNSVNNLAYLFKEKGDLAAAESFARRAAETGARVRGEDHPNTLSATDTLADILAAQGNIAGADAAYQRAILGFSRAFPEGHPQLADAAFDYSLLCAKTGRAAEALAFARQAAASAATLPADHPLRQRCEAHLAALERK